MFAMSVLFGISKKENVTQEKAFLYSALIVAGLSCLLLFIVRNPDLKEKVARQPSENTEAEMENMQIVTSSSS